MGDFQRTLDGDLVCAACHGHGPRQYQPRREEQVYLDLADVDARRLMDQGSLTQLGEDGKHRVTVTVRLSIPGLFKRR